MFPAYIISIKCFSVTTVRFLQLRGPRLTLFESFKAPANEETLLRKHRCGRKCSRFAHAHNICCGRKRFASETQKMFLNFFRNILRPQQMFPRLHGKEAKKLFCFPLVCSPWKHYEQQRFRNNLSSFAGKTYKEI